MRKKTLYKILLGIFAVGILFTFTLSAPVYARNHKAKSDRTGTSTGIKAEKKKAEKKEKIRNVEVQGEVRGVDPAARTVTILVEKAQKLKPYEKKEIQVGVGPKAKIVVADKKGDLSAVKIGDRVNLKVTKDGEKFTTSKIVAKAAKAKKEEVKKKEGVKPQEVAVSIVSTGFTPAQIKVKAGTKVTWTNQDTVAHQPSSNPHPVHIDLAELGTGPVLQQGQTFSFTPIKPGTWGYHDHLNAALGGTIEVE